MRATRATAISTLIFVALSAFVGAVPMIEEPGGTPWWMPLSLLRYSPFHSFLIPGIILFAAIGMPSCWVLWLAITNRPGYGRWVAFQGCVLLGWIVTEMVMLRLVVWPQILYGAIALLLVASGLILSRKSA
jgi:hypothetical protein